MTIHSLGDSMEKLNSTSARRRLGPIRDLPSKTGNQALKAAGMLAIGCFTCAVVSLGHGNGQSSGANNHSQQHPHYHGHYWDPFWGGWYPGYAGVYDSNYFYTPTPDQVVAAKKQVQSYFVAVRKGLRQSVKHRYIAVQTLNPTKKQLEDYEKKRADAQSSAASGEGQMSNRWVASDKLRCVMLFDTQSKQFVGSGCYVIAATPPSGTVAKFDTYSAQFVGTSTL
jgi:hypothetical protein